MIVVALTKLHHAQGHDPRPDCAEGFHRLAAAREAELETIACEVRVSGLRDAILHSAGANATHGLRWSNADKRRAVLLLLEDEEWSAWADREIARRCTVSADLVGAMRRELTVVSDSEAAPQPRTYEHRHGNVTQMRTGAIGRKSPAPAPPAPAPPAEDPSPAGAAPVAANVVSLGPRLFPASDARARAEPPLPQGCLATSHAMGLWITGFVTTFPIGNVLVRSEAPIGPSRNRTFG